MRVKICGITNYEDAMVAIEYGADALGFVFYEKSPRYISPKDASDIIKKLPPFVEKVGLFVEDSKENIMKISSFCGITLAQLHWEVTKEFIDSLPIATLPVIRVKEPKDIELFNDRYRLVDAFVKEYGGSGKRLNLDWFNGIDCSKIILAGGLSADNLCELDGFGFYGVDVSSATEATKGKKDPNKVKAFIDNAKSLR